MRSYAGMSIKLLLSAVIGVLSLMLITLSIGPLLSAIERVAVAQRVVITSETSGYLLDTLQNFRNERSTAISLLLANQVITPQNREKLLRFRQGADQGMQQTLEMMSDLQLPGVLEARERLEKSFLPIKELRASTDSAVLLQKAERDPALSTHFQTVGDTFLQALASVTDLIDGAIRLHDPTIDELLTIKRAAWTVRMSAGIAGTLGVAALGDHRPWTATEANTVFSANVAGKTAWAQVSELASRPDTPSATKAAFAHAQEVYFGRDLEHRTAVVQALSTGQNPGTTSAEWLDFMVATAGTLGGVVDAALKDMIATANAQVAEAKFTLILDAVVLVAAIFVAIGGFAVVFKRVCRPLVALTDAMRQLAQQDFDIKIPGTGRRDELGAMALTVGVFRENGLTMRRLEAEGAEQQLLAAAQRETAAAEQAHVAAQQAEVVKALGFGLDRLAQGDLTCTLNRDFAPEYDRLRVNFNEAVLGLQGVVKDIISHTSAIRTGTQEIASASDDLSRRTEQQAAGLEQTAAALQEITATVRRTADDSQEARKAAGATRDDAERSGSVVRDAVAAMAAIEGSARQISQIIGVIDEIAFQTNLLALNAGVEAARAGESGRGFAVVASEVRALAQRSADAAKEIKALIRTSEQQVERGVALVGETGEALGRIVSQVGTISGLIVKIAASAQEQAAGLNDVNTAVAEMDQVTQQNAAMVEQTTTSTHALSHETEALGQAISRFHVQIPNAAGIPKHGLRAA